MRKLRIIIPLLSFVIVIALLRFVFYIGYVPTESMEPTISAGSRIVGIRIFDELHIGDIIVFEHKGTNMVKRIAAVSGDKMENNIIVPEDCYYVLGDNIFYSYDSRSWNNPFVKHSNILARVIIY